MRIYIVFAFLLILTCLFPHSTRAETAPNSTPERYAAIYTTKEALLLFWDEKDLSVESATRSLKPLSKVAENITVITAKDIADMNAHTVAEVLERVAGVFLAFTNEGFGSTSDILMQGTDNTSTLVLLDGVTWNFLASGSVETNSIPVRIIDRIEIIKGPSSSAWGSSLGGVINIITKNAANTHTPTATLIGSYGERNTQDYSGEVSGKAGPVGYYVFAGKQKSDGLRDNRSFDSYSLYSKLKVDISKDLNLGFTIGYSEPHEKFLDSIADDFTSKGISRVLFATGSLNAAITSELSLQVTLRTLKQKFFQLNDILSTGEPFVHVTFDENTTEGSGKLIWTHGMHTGVMGIDISRGTLNQTFDGIFTLAANPSIDKWGVYANDTLSIGKFTFTPGVRLDRNNISGSFVSSNFGVTYKLAEKTILRASVARGFNNPALSVTSVGGLFFDPNPSLKPTIVWSYQVGAESHITDYLWLKTALFRYDSSDDTVVATAPSGNRTYVNGGDVKRTGVEVQAETVPIYNISVKAGFAYVDINEQQEPFFKNYLYTYNIGVKYDDNKTLMAEIFGHYIWFDLPEDRQAQYNAFIWTANLRKTIYSTQKIKTDLFVTAHNILNGSQYPSAVSMNPRRWVEGGLRFTF